VNDLTTKIRDSAIGGFCGPWVPNVTVLRWYGLHGEGFEVKWASFSHCDHHDILRGCCIRVMSQCRGPNCKWAKSKTTFCEGCIQCCAGYFTLNEFIFHRKESHPIKNTLNKDLTWHIWLGIFDLVFLPGRSIVEYIQVSRSFWEQDSANKWLLEL